MRWQKIKRNSDALSYCQGNDWDCFLAWAQHNGATVFSRIDVWDEDVPYIIKNGGKRIPRTKLKANPGTFKADDWLDHSRLYKNPVTGQVWLVSHIYNNTPDTITELMKWCAENDLAVMFLYSSWYNSGKALGVVFTSWTAYREQCKREVEEALRGYEYEV